LPLVRDRIAIVHRGVGCRHEALAGQARAMQGRIRP
jgi:hypothetical protein